MPETSHRDPQILRASILIGAASVTAVVYTTAGLWALGIDLSLWPIIVSGLVGAIAGACVAGSG